MYTSYVIRLNFLSVAETTINLTDNKRIIDAMCKLIARGNSVLIEFACGEQVGWCLWAPHVVQDQLYA